MLPKGRLIGFPVVNVRVALTDGASHAVDSSDIAFQKPRAVPGVRSIQGSPADPGADREGRARRARNEFSGAMLGTLMSRRGMIIGTTGRRRPEHHRG